MAGICRRTGTDLAKGFARTVDSTTPLDGTGGAGAGGVLVGADGAGGVVGGTVGARVGDQKADGEVVAGVGDGEVAVSAEHPPRPTATATTRAAAPVRTRGGVLRGRRLSMRGCNGVRAVRRSRGGDAPPRTR